MIFMVSTISPFFTMTSLTTLDCYHDNTRPATYRSCNKNLAEYVPGLCSGDPHNFVFFHVDHDALGAFITSNSIEMYRKSVFGNF